MPTMFPPRFLAIVALVAAIPAQGTADPLALYRAQMIAAEYALRLQEQPEAQRWLEATDPALRQLEWRLRAAALDDSLATVTLEAGRGTALDLSPDGAWLAVGTDQGMLELRRADSGEVVHRRQVHTAEIAQVRFDRAGKRLVTAGHDRKVRVIAADDLRELLEFSGHGYPVGGAEFTADGAQIASVSYERPDGGVVGTLHVFDAETGAIARTMTGGRKPLTNLAISPDGSRLAAASWDFCLFVWPLAGGAAQKLPVPDEGVYNGVDGVAFSRDGKWLAAGVRDHTARIFDAATGALAATLRGHGDLVAKLRFSPDGRYLATASGDGTIGLWDTATWARTGSLRGHGDDVLDLAFAADGTALWTSSADGSLRRWDPDCPWYGGTTMRASRAAYVCRFSRDGRRLATCSYDGRIQVWCADTQTLLGSFQAHPADKSCHMLEWTPDDTQLVSGSYATALKVHDAVTFAEVARYEHTEGFYWLRLSPDGTRIAACSGSQVLVVDRQSMRLLHTFRGHSASVQSASWSRDGNRVVSCARDGKAIVWDPTDGTIAATIAWPRPDVAEAVFTPDGRDVIVAGRGGLVRRHSATDGAEIRVLQRHRNGFDHLDLSPDGRRLAIASRGLTLVDAEHGGDVATFSPHGDRPFHVAFDPSGERIASVSTDASLAVLDPRPLRERLRTRDAALSDRAAVAPQLDARLAAGESLTAVAAAVQGDASLTARDRFAWIALLTMRSAAAAK